VKSQGIQIIAQNYLCANGRSRRSGEIDLIGLQTSDQRLIFFEVKYRKSAQFGHPAETVTLQKQQRIIKCAQRFLQVHPQYQHHLMQFDVLTFLETQATPERIENAFGL